MTYWTVKIPNMLKGTSVILANRRGILLYLSLAAKLAEVEKKRKLITRKATLSQ